MFSFAIITFGCKLNQAESTNLKSKLIGHGLKAVSENQAADFYIINSCSVTQKAERRVRQKIAQIKRRHPRGFIMVTGCCVAKDNPQVDQYINKTKLVPLILKKISRRSKNCWAKNYSSVYCRNNRTRAFIKIQDGCDNFCAYCIVPFLRGRPKTRSAKNIIQEIQSLERQGFQEIVLVGTDLRKFQDRSSGIGDLTDLLKIILIKTKIPRFRLSSLWPSAVKQRLINLIQKEPRICPHLHLSIQSGCDKILKKMGRDYRRRELLSLIKKASKIKNLNLTADIIVGFPGETEGDFRKTLDLVKRGRFLKTHIFPFSVRPHTRAAKMLEQVPEAIKKLRSQKLLDLNNCQAKKLKKQYLGQSLPVLFESKKNNLWGGLTPNYFRTYVHSRANLANRLVNIKLIRLYKDGFYGKMIKELSLAK